MSDLATVTPGNTVTRLVGKVTLIESDDTTVARRLGVITGFNADGTVQLQLAASGINITPVQLMRGAQVGVGDSVWVDMKGTDPLVIGHSNTPLPPIGLEPWIEVLGGVGFANGWVNFGAPYDTAAYYKDPDGFVHLKGLISTGTLGTGAFTLPVGYRPLEYHVFSSIQNNLIGTISLPTNGAIVPFTNNTFVSLNGISFPTVKDDALWIPGAMESGWQTDWTTNGATAAIPAFYVRDDGFVYTKGAYRAGTVNASLCILPDSTRPRLSHLLATMSGGAFSRVDIAFTGHMLLPFGGNNTWQTLGGQAWWNHRSDEMPWITPAYLNSWVAYGGFDSGYYPLQYIKDKFGVVHLRGMLKNGTLTAGLPLANLPAGYRPAKDAVLLVCSGGGGQVSRLDITSTGDIKFQTGSNGFMSVHGRFRAEQ